MRPSLALRFLSGSKTRDVITLFHAPSNPSSVRVLNMLKTAAATASETATEDQASDHSAQMKLQRSSFDLEVTENDPTSDQSRNIKEYLQNTPHSGKAVFQKPVIVDWSRGRASEYPDPKSAVWLLGPEAFGPVLYADQAKVAGENESEILKMLNMKE